MISLTSEIKVGVFAREFLGLKGYLTNKLLIDLLLLLIRQGTVLCDYNLLWFNLIYLLNSTSKIFFYKTILIIYVLLAKLFSIFNKY